MSNEVIIDGCNVAECEHLWKDNSVIELNFCRINFDNNYFSNGIPCCDKCNKHPDCYFKQLQRAKAELEMSKQYAELLKANRCQHHVLNECSQEHHDNCVGKKQCILDLEQIISSLKAENDTLHITISKLKEDLSQAETSLYAWKAENEKLKAELEQYKKSKQKLIKKLKRLSSDKNDDYETTHYEADRLLIQYIKDKEIEAAYDDVGKWYS